MTEARRRFWDGGRNPSVTVLPCQPPLGKGALGTGGTDCHTSDIGHWFAMTRFFARSAVQGRLGRTEASAPTDGYKECNGRATARVAPTEALQGVRRRGVTARVAPTEALQGVRWRRRPQGSPLRKRNMECVEAGRCGERTERCQWQRKRGERVAAVKIGGVRRKAAQKFWAPQQGHRPLRSARRAYYFDF